VTGTISNNYNYAAGLIYMYIYIYIYVYTGVLGNFRRVGEVGVFSCSDSVKNETHHARFREETASCTGCRTQQINWTDEKGKPSNGASFSQILFEYFPCYAFC
jgi:hypothetical protein